MCQNLCMTPWQLEGGQEGEAGVGDGEVLQVPSHSVEGVRGQMEEGVRGEVQLLEVGHAAEGLAVDRRDVVGRQVQDHQELDL